jgi:Glycerol-3-phosphate acyltransferase C-terminal region
MIERRLLHTKTNGNIALRVGAETFILFASSLIWPMVDSYYATVLYILSMAIGKEGSSASVEASQIVKRVQWLSEALYQEKVLKLFEACNIESIKNAVATLKEMGVLQ